MTPLFTTPWLSAEVHLQTSTQDSNFRKGRRVTELANNSDLNFVFIASYRDSDIENIPEINYCGNILNIYEKSDPSGVSALERKATSTCKIQHFKEIELNTGMGHGFLFKPLKEWIEPTIKWANENYNVE